MAKLAQHFQLHFTSASRIMKLISDLINQDLTLGFCDPWILRVGSVLGRGRGQSTQVKKLMY